MKLFNVRGSIYITISALMFALYGVFLRQLEQYDVFYQTYVKSFLIIFILLAIGIYQKSYRKIDKKDYKAYAVVLLFTIFSVAPITYAYRYLELGTASFLFYASLTIFSYIFGALFFSEKFDTIKIISLILSILGMLLVFAVKLPQGFLLPIAMCVLNGLAASGEVVFSKLLSNKYSSNQITVLIFVSIAISHLVLSVFLGENQDIGIMTRDLHWTLLFCVASIVGMFTVIEGFKILEPSIGAIIGLSEIVFSVLLGVLFYADKISGQILAGGILIILAAALPNLYDLYLLKQKKH
ncbi:DMT family transporter [Candidatus Woesebacteria bacterium]|nr:DMT family transporter [Candidatus Woesebacteria bacterium]